MGSTPQMTVRMPEPLKTDAVAKARREGVALAHVVRVLLAQWTYSDEHVWPD